MLSRKPYGVSAPVSVYDSFVVYFLKQSFRLITTKKRHAFWTYFLFLVAALASADVIAQRYPIQSTVQLQPPFSPFWTDYSSPQSQLFFVQLNANDVSISNYRCKLRLTIEGLGITIRTRPTFNPEPLIIDGGIPVMLYGYDIADYFHPDNLEFIGYSRDELVRSGRLPEGVYRFSIEVLDYNRGTPVSNRGTAVAWIVLNDPPLLNLPINHHKVTLLDPVNIPFMWTPRNTASPNAAFSTEYIFRLVEIWPDNRDPNDAFLSLPPLYEVVTDQTQLVYTMAEPTLLPGRKYAWQVQARDTEGKDIFKNEGKSEVFVFQFGNVLIGTPQDFRSDGSDLTTISVRWDMPDDGEFPATYRVRYRVDETSEWNETTTLDRWLTLSGLQPGTLYEVQVRSEKETLMSTYSEILEISTSQIAESGYACGQPDTMQVPEITVPLISLKPGDTFTSRDFNVLVTEVRTSNAGFYEGDGIVQVHFLNGASIQVTFAGTINNMYQLVSGQVESVYVKGSEIGQVVDEMDRIGDDVDQKPGGETRSDTTIFIDTNIDSIYVDADGNVVIIDEEGEITTDTLSAELVRTNPSSAVTITDQDGTQYVVEHKDGQTTVREVKQNHSPPASVSREKIRELALDLLKEIRRDLGGFLNLPDDAPRRGAGPIAFVDSLPKGLGVYKDDPYAFRAIFDYAGEFNNDQYLQEELIGQIESDTTVKRIIAKHQKIFDEKDANFKDYLPREDWLTIRDPFIKQIVPNALAAFINSKYRAMQSNSTCLQNGIEKSRTELLKYGDFTMAMIAGSLETALCLTTEEQCRNSGDGVKFSYGLVNGILQQLNIPEMRDALVELIKTSAEAKWECITNPADLAQQLTEATSANDYIRIITRCTIGIEVNVSEVGDQFSGAWDYINTNIDEPYFQGQATAFIVTIILPAAKTVQGLKIIQSFKNFRANFLAKIKTIPKLKNLDEVVEGVAKGGDDLIAALTGSIKSTYDDLIKAGLRSEVKANSILLKNTTGETVAIIYNGKLTPTKWAWQKNFSATNKTATSEGYIIIKDGSALKFDLGFKEGRKLEAKEVNDYLVKGQGKDLDGQPYWAGTQVDEVLLGKKGETIYFIENYNGGAANPGQYASKDPITTIKELRENLAVKEAWKETAKEPTLRAYRVKADLKARSGIIGRQSDKGIELPGGAHQYEIIDYLGGNWKIYLEEVGVKNGIKLK